MVHFCLIYREMPEFDQWRGYVPEDRCISFAIRKDQEYIILLDSTASEDVQKNTLRHELAHIILGHLTEDDRIRSKQAYLDNFNSVEAEADEYAARMTDDEFDYLMTFADTIRTI